MADKITNKNNLFKAKTPSIKGWGVIALLSIYILEPRKCFFNLGLIANAPKSLPKG